MAINWAQTPLAQQRQRELQEAQQFWQDIVAGRVNPAALSAEQWGQLMNIISKAQQQYPNIDLSRAMQTYVTPALGGNLPTELRNTALNILATRAAQTGQWDPTVGAFLSRTPASTADIMAQGNILATLARSFYQTPEWQSAYRRFLQTYAPGGSVVGAGAPIWAAVARPYFTLREIAPDFATRFGEVTFPTSAENMSQLARDVLSGILESGLATQGLVMGPSGPARETPLDRIRRIMGEVYDVLQNWLQPSFYGGRWDEALRLKGAKGALGGGTETGSTNVRISQETGQEALRQSAFEALKQRVGMFRTAKDALASLTRNATEIKAVLGDKLYNDLLNYVRSLPPDSPGRLWAPTGTGEPVEDPFMAWIRRWRK